VILNVRGFLVERHKDPIQLVLVSQKTSRAPSSLKVCPLGCVFQIERGGLELVVRGCMSVRIGTDQASLV
jgi:ferredoxin-like protein FixX